MTVVGGIGVGVAVVIAITALTAYFVAQEFGFMAVDRSRLRALAAGGDTGAARALDVTGRTSFMLSGAQLGITVTGLLAGYVAEPMIGRGISRLLGGTAVPPGVGTAVGATVALLLVTVVQMVFGELFPKNLAIARPEPVARRLALSTNAYLRVFGPVINVFDRAAILLLRLVRIEPVQDVHHAATPQDLQRIVADSAASGDLPSDLSALLDRSLDFGRATAEHAMVPRPRVLTTTKGQRANRARAVMIRSGYSRLPVRGGGVDELTGVLNLRDLLALDDDELASTTVEALARPAVVIPTFLRLPEALNRMRAADEEFACVVDEYGGLAGIVTLEDIAEELAGEITDKAVVGGADEPRPLGEGVWLVPGSLGVDEVERLIGHELPSGHFESVGGLVINALGRLPRYGDEVTIALPRDPAAEEDDATPTVVMLVESIDRRVPKSLRVSLTETNAPHGIDDHDADGRTTRPGTGEASR